MIPLPIMFLNGPLPWGQYRTTGFKELELGYMNVKMTGRHIQIVCKSTTNSCLLDSSKFIGEQIGPRHFVSYKLQKVKVSNGLV
jgi:hypothetical protein